MRRFSRSHLLLWLTLEAVLAACSSGGSTHLGSGGNGGLAASSSSSAGSTSTGGASAAGTGTSGPGSSGSSTGLGSTGVGSGTGASSTGSSSLPAFASVDAGAVIPWRMAAGYPPLLNEVPPALFPIPGAFTGLLVSTSYSFGCLIQANPAIGAFALGAPNCREASLPATRTPELGFAAAALPGAQPWRRTYRGLFTAHLAPVLAPTVVVSFVHGEDQNELDHLPDGGAVCFQNDVLPALACASCASQQTDAGYDVCYPSYSAFISAAYDGYDADAGFGLGGYGDLGPVVWPSSGYTDGGGGKLSYGLRHPSALVSPDPAAPDGPDYFFVYYREETPTSPGIKVARAPVLASGLPGAFLGWTGSGFDAPSLPAGFSAANAAAFFDQPGAPAAALVDDNAVRFSVAQLLGAKTTLYLAVAEVVDSSNAWHLWLHASRDLVHFGPPVELNEAAAAELSQARLRYPIFLRADGSSNTLVDAAGFYIVGGDQTVFPPAVNELSLSVQVQ